MHPLDPDAMLEELESIVCPELAPPTLPAVVVVEEVEGVDAAVSGASGIATSIPVLN